MATIPSTSINTQVHPPSFVVVIWLWSESLTPVRHWVFLEMSSTLPHYHLRPPVLLSFSLQAKRHWACYGPKHRWRSESFGKLENQSSQDETRLEAYCGGRCSFLRVGYLSIERSHVLVLTLQRLRLGITLLQLPSVFNQIYLRMAAICVFSLSFASGVSATIFRAMESELDSSEKAQRWIRASRDPTSLASLDFWLCLAWPLTSLTWWVKIGRLIL